MSNNNMAGRHRLNALIDAMQIVAEASGEMAVTDFNDATWKMLCEINEKLARAAAEEAEKLAQR
jgi:hypothetical protein